MSFTTAATAMSMPRLRSIGFMPAATSLSPSRMIDAARTVAVVVPSPARSWVFEATSRTICAPIFSNLSSSSISLATVTPSLVMRGAPYDLSRTTLRPFGPNVTLTAFTRMSTPPSKRWRASVLNLTSLAAICLILPLGGFALGAGFNLNDTHEVRFLHDHKVFAVEPDLGPRPLSEQHPLTHFDIERVNFTILGASARPGRDDLPLHRLFLGGVGDDDAASRLLLLLDPANQQT